MQLYRAGVFLQKVFDYYREHSWAQPIREVRVDEDGSIHVYYADATSGSVYARFPTEMFATEDDKRAVLVHEADAFATRNLHTTVINLLKG